MGKKRGKGNGSEAVDSADEEDDDDGLKAMTAMTTVTSLRRAGMMSMRKRQLLLGHKSPRPRRTLWKSRAQMSTTENIKKLQWIRWTMGEKGEKQREQQREKKDERNMEKVEGKREGMRGCER